MKILYLSQYYRPEMGAPAARVAELSEHWVHAYQEVSVLTGFPNYPTGVVPTEYKNQLSRLVMREQMGGVNIIRTWLWPLPNQKALERILNYTSFFVSSSFTGMFLPHPDVMIATIPQILVGLSGKWLSTIWKIPLILEVRDLWPDSGIASGAVERKSPLVTLMNSIAWVLYHGATHIVVVSPSAKEELINKWKIPPEKISTIENAVDTNLFSPGEFNEHIKAELGLQNQFIVSYIGNLGKAQGLELILSAAEKMASEDPNISFLFVGEGSEKERLQEIARDRKLTNVRFIPGQWRGMIPSWIGVSDVCLVPLKKQNAFLTTIPSKMLEFMACERPVLLGVKGQAHEIMDKARAGVFFEPGNLDSLINAIRQLSKNQELRMTLGQNGRKFVLEKFSRQKAAQRYLDILRIVHQNSNGKGR